MSCFGWYDIGVSIKAGSEDQVSRIEEEFNNLDLKYRDICIRRDRTDALSLNLDRDSGEYYNSTDTELEAIANWIHTKGYQVTGYILAEIESEHLRGEFHGGRVEWESVDWLGMYTNEQIRELYKYAQEHFK